MRVFLGLCLLCFSFGRGMAFAQIAHPEPQIITKAGLGGKVAMVEVAARFVTAIRLPVAVNSVVVGDPSEFQVEHSEREPRLVFVKAISTKPTETNLLISTTSGRQVSLLLVNRGEIASGRPRVDFLLRYEPAGGFFVAPSGFPFALVGETVSLKKAEQVSPNATQRLPKPAVGANLGTAGEPPASRGEPPGRVVSSDGLDKLLEQQENGPLTVLYGGKVQ